MGQTVFFAAERAARPYSEPHPRAAGLFWGKTWFHWAVTDGRTQAAVLRGHAQVEYTPENIDGLLFRRHENKKLLLAGKYPKGTPKRTKEQDITYRNALGRILQTV